jgi:hypothetical protein
MTRLLPPHRITRAAALCALAGLVACSEDNTPPTDSSPGTLQVVVNATGTNVDGLFSIQLNGGEMLPYVTGTAFVRDDLPASVYTVRLSGVASNCTLQGSDAVQVAVYAGQRSQVTFSMTCA